MAAKDKWAETRVIVISTYLFATAIFTNRKYFTRIPRHQANFCVPQVLESLEKEEPTIIHGHFGVGKTGLALDVADHSIKAESLPPVFWLQFRPDIKGPSQDFDAEILKMQGVLYRQITANTPVG